MREGLRILPGVFTILFSHGTCWIFAVKLTSGRIRRPSRRGSFSDEGGFVLGFEAFEAFKAFEAFEAFER